MAFNLLISSLISGQEPTNGQENNNNKKRKHVKKYIFKINHSLFVIGLCTKQIWFILRPLYFPLSYSQDDLFMPEKYRWAIHIRCKKKTTVGEFFVAWTWMYNQVLWYLCILFGLLFNPFFSFFLLLIKSCMKKKIQFTLQCSIY